MRNKLTRGQRINRMRNHNVVPPVGIQETCLYCGRVPWGNYQYLGNGQWRHEECSPGSDSWKDWYDRHPEAHTSAGDALREYKGKLTW